MCTRGLLRFRYMTNHMTATTGTVHMLIGDASHCFRYMTNHMTATTGTMHMLWKLCRLIHGRPKLWVQCPCFRSVCCFVAYMVSSAETQTCMLHLPVFVYYFLSVLSSHVLSTAETLTYMLNTSLHTLSRYLVS